jgi:hypothetical protein
LLLSPKEKKTNLYNFKVELVNIIKGCLEYNINKRLKLETILNKLEYLNNNISSEFHSKILETINISQESETNNSINKNNYNSKNIINNQEMDSEDFKESSIDNNFNNNINENNFPSINKIKQIQNLNIMLKTKNNINKEKIEKERYKDETELNDKKYMKDSEKKQNIMDYFKESKNTKEKDEYKELDKSKFIIINNNILFFRNR